MSKMTGWQVAYALGSAQRALVGDPRRSMADLGHPGMRTADALALEAIGADGCSVTELGRRLGVTRQAAAKTAEALDAAGYVERVPERRDRRALRLVRTARADDLLRRSAAALELRIEAWRQEIGSQRLETALETIVRMGS